MDKLATGESRKGEPLHDRQHPHDLLMELAVQYQREMTGGLVYQLYGALAGEPALGPVAFPHRVSALSNPATPMMEAATRQSAAGSTRARPRCASPPHRI